MTALPYLTLPSGWAGCYTCPVLRPYRFGPMRSPDVTRRSQWCHLQENMQEYWVNISMLYEIVRFWGGFERSVPFALCRWSEGQFHVTTPPKQKPHSPNWVLPLWQLCWQICVRCDSNVVKLEFCAYRIFFVVVNLSESQCAGFAACLFVTRPIWQGSWHWYSRCHRKTGNSPYSHKEHEALGWRRSGAGKRSRLCLCLSQVLLLQNANLGNWVYVVRCNLQGSCRSLKVLE